MYMVYYFAYGSNLHPLRLSERVSSSPIGVTSLQGYRLTFHKISSDGSGKCNITKTTSNNDIVYGVIYKLSRSQKATLDKIEGVGNGYNCKKVALEFRGITYKCLVYIAVPKSIDKGVRPYHWYKQLVLMGGNYWEFPEPYISSIKQNKSIADLDIKRRNKNKKLINKILSYERLGR